MAAFQIDTAKIAQTLPEGDVPIVMLIDGAQRGDNPRDGVAVGVGFYQCVQQLLDDIPGICRGIGPVQ